MKSTYKLTQKLDGLRQKKITSVKNISGIVIFSFEVNCGFYNCNYAITYPNKLLYISHNVRQNT